MKKEIYINLTFRCNCGQRIYIYTPWKRNKPFEFTCAKCDSTYSHECHGVVERRGGGNPLHLKIAIFCMVIGIILMIAELIIKLT